MVVVWAAVLLAGLVSGEVVTTLEEASRTAPVAALVLTVTVTLVTGPPTRVPSRFPSAQVTVPGEPPSWVQPEPVAEMKMVVAGKGTVSTTFPAVSAALFSTFSV
jgi:hypothetical protein